MENLSFDEGLKSYKINGDPNRILRFNPGDVNILTRYKEVVNNLNEIANELPDAKIKPDGTAEDNAEIVGTAATWKLTQPCNSGFLLPFFPLADRRSHFL